MVVGKVEEMEDKVGMDTVMAEGTVVFAYMASIRI
jgi:hypothetical protein